MKMIDFARESMGLPESSSCELIPLTVRGSDRSFFRFTWNNKDSAILVHYDPKRVENAYYGDISLFLHSAGIPVPHLLFHDRTECLMIMEDMGKADLWSFKDAPWTTRSALYQKTLVIVHRLHSIPEDSFPSQQVRLMERFGPELYLWEREYFREHFVNGVCNIQYGPSSQEKLEAELFTLAERLQGTKSVLVHRDLQSQNVMIRDGESFLIDFQGMRFGSPFYDLGSLLCDPYVDFSDSEIEELLFFYYNISQQNLDWPAFRGYFWEASAQRLMQALGAYGFLGLKKDLTTFLAHIPAALHNLHRASSQVTSLPLLNDLSQSCRRAIEKK